MDWHSGSGDGETGTGVRRIVKSRQAEKTERCGQRETEAFIS